ncbi:MAG: hypothetical protein ABEH81_01195 [Halopenitus sp.]
MGVNTSDPDEWDIDQEYLRAREEIKEAIGEDIEEITFRFGRETTEKAFKKVLQDYRCRRFINPYPIDEDAYKQLRQMTRNRRVNVGDASKEKVADLFIEQLDELEPHEMDGFQYAMEEEGEPVVFAWVDLLLSDLFVEERDEYAQFVTDRVMEEYL